MQVRATTYHFRTVCVILVNSYSIIRLKLTWWHVGYTLLSNHEGTSAAEELSVPLPSQGDYQWTRLQNECLLAEIPPSMNVLVACQSTFQSKNSVL